MDAEKIERLRLVIEDMAGLVALIDEDSLDKIAPLNKLITSITSRRSNPKEIILAARKAREAAKEVKSGKTSFKSSYKKLCGTIETLQKTLRDATQQISEEWASEKEPDVETHVYEEIQQVVETTEEKQSNEINPLQEPQVLEEFEMQFELLEEFISNLKKKDDHILGVVHHFFCKISTLLSGFDEAVKRANESSQIATEIRSGDKPFKKGMKEVRVAAEWFRNLLNASKAQMNESELCISIDEAECDNDESKASCEFIEKQSYLLEKFARDINGISVRLAEDMQNLQESARTLHEAAAEAAIPDMSYLFESIEDALTQHGQKPASGLIGSLLETKTFINECFERLSTCGVAPERERINRAVDAFKLVPPPVSASTSSAISGKKKKNGLPPKIVLDISNPELIEFVTESHEYLHDAEMALLALEKDPGSKECVNEIFRGFHNIKGIAGFLNLKDVQEVAHHAESLMEKVRNGALEMNGSTDHAAFEAMDILKEMVKRIDRALSGDSYATPPEYYDVIERLQNCGTDGAFEEVILETDIEDEIMSDNEKDDVASTSSLQAIARSGNNGNGKSETMVKVGTARLDTLIDAVGELVIANAMVTQEPQILSIRNPKLSRNVSHLGKITRELQELAMSMRMVSIKNTFQKMTRLARDVSIKCGVPVELTYSGEDTELDRNVVEEISSPLVHMVRNSVDHGIESPAERKKLGKSEMGHVHLSAAHEGGTIVIKISDDGRGLDKDAILEKAIKLNLVSPDAVLTDREIFHLIFHPGFSTAKKVTDVSGRGVGMDVVKRAIEKLRGRIDIKSEFGKGSVFTIRLPLTLAIIDGMVITVASERYVIPTISIVESLRPDAGQISTVAEKGEMLSIRGDLVPLFRLHRLFEVEGANTDATNSLSVVVGSNGSRCALMVDALLGQQQVVIKTLGKTFNNIDGVSGGAIMGDGKIALILDTTGIVRLAHSN